MRAGTLRLLVLLVLPMLGCTSPEAARARGGGPGADLGNTGPTVRIHAGTRPFYQTPCLGTAAQCAEQEAAAAR